jgi:hypothetical protein
MTVSPDVNFEELARSTDDFNAAQLKAVSEAAARMCACVCVCVLLGDMCEGCTYQFRCGVVGFVKVWSSVCHDGTALEDLAVIQAWDAA